MAILSTTPLNDGVITNLYTATHPVMGDGIVIETIRCYRNEEPKANTPTSIRFFPKDITRGALYSGQLLYSDGCQLNEWSDIWELEDVEPREIQGPEDYIGVNDFNEFHPWDWNDSTVEQDDDDQYRWRLHVNVRHTETRGRRRLIQDRTWTHTTGWITAPSQRAAEALLKDKFKSEFFDKFQGCKMFMKTERRFNYNNS